MILVIDNFDSFTFNLVQYIGQAVTEKGLGHEIVVKRNNEISVEQIVALNPSGIMLSPGPCTPNESGVCLDVLSEALTGARLTGVPIFGVCLGHQAIGQTSGAIVHRAGRIMHGKASLIEHDDRGLFRGMPQPFSAIRYHSLVIDETTLSPDFVVTARSADDNEIMGVRHLKLPIEGVQFHPESVKTEAGYRIVENFVTSLG